MEDSDADVRYYASRAKEKTTHGGAEPMNRESQIVRCVTRHLNDPLVVS